MLPKQHRQPLPEIQLLEEALSFCHTAMHFLPGDAVFMDVIGGVRGDSITANFSSLMSAGFHVILIHDCSPKHPGLGALLSVHFTRPYQQALHWRTSPCGVLQLPSCLPRAENVWASF